VLERRTEASCQPETRRKKKGEKRNPQGEKEDSLSIQKGFAPPDQNKNQGKPYLPKADGIPLLYRKKKGKKKNGPQTSPIKRGREGKASSTPVKKKTQKILPASKKDILHRPKERGGGDAPPPPPPRERRGKDEHNNFPTKRREGVKSQGEE